MAAEPWRQITEAEEVGRRSRGRKAGAVKAGRWSQDGMLYLAKASTMLAKEAASEIVQAKLYMPSYVTAVVTLVRDCPDK